MDAVSLIQYFWLPVVVLAAVKKSTGSDLQIQLQYPLLKAVLSISTAGIQTRMRSRGGEEESNLSDRLTEGGQEV